MLKYTVRMLPLLYMIAVWYQSGYFRPESVTDLPLITLIPLGMLFEFAHLFQFGILYLLIIVALLTYGPLTKRKDLFAVTVSMLFAFADEIHQIFVPFRSATVSDLIKDIAGIFVAWLFIRKTYSSESSRNEQQ